MTASEFAEKKGISYQTVVRWARKSLIPGVKITEFGKFRVYMIPEEALRTFERPKTGRPLKARAHQDGEPPAAGLAKKRASKKAAKKGARAK